MSPKHLTHPIRWTLLFALIGSISACGGVPGDNAGPLVPSDEFAGDGVGQEGPERVVTAADLSDSDMEKIRVLRLAIDQGLRDGKYALADEVNIELGNKGVTKTYEASLQSNATIPVPASVACPFMNPDGDEGSIDCRALVGRATVSAYARLTALKAANPLDESFDEYREESEFWFEEGLMSGIDNEGVIALSSIRASGACDQAPKPTQTAYEAGVEAGRGRFIQMLDERAASFGMAIDYPEDIRAIQVCDANVFLLMPALVNAQSGLAEWAEANPLCPNVEAKTVDDSVRLNDVEERYLAGVKEGLQTEFRIAEEVVFRGVSCDTDDPLVVDVEGDGVDLVPLESSSAKFDLYGIGMPSKCSWIKGDDALLAWDENGNGSIDSGRELFGNLVGQEGFHTVPSGFDNLARFDEAANGGNGDGRIDDGDAIFDELLLWQDDGDGVSQPEELHGLRSLGVASIQTRYREVDHEDAQISHGTTFLRTSEGAATYGADSGSVYDAWLRHGRLHDR